LKSRSTLILVAVFAALAAYLYFFEINKTPEQLSGQRGTPTATPPPYVLQLDASKVKSLQIRDLQKGKEVTVNRTDTGWQLLPLDKPADADKIGQALSYITTLQATRVLTNVTDIKAFGLTSASLELRLVMADNTVYAITVGNKTPNDSGYYVIYTGATDKVFVVETLVIDGAKVFFEAPPLEATATPSAPAAPALATPEPSGTPKP
jgi:hypothetical protein